MPENSGWISGMILNHYPDESKPRSQYLPLLELSVEENPTDDRATFWLGREYVYHGDYEKAINTLKRHLSLPTAQWLEERSASMRFISHSYEELGNKREARSWLFRSLAECPNVREPYLALAKAGYLEADWPLCFAMAEKALTVTESTGSYLVDPASWGYAFYDYCAISGYRMGMFEKARDYAVKALEMDPENLRLKSNLSLIEDRCKRKSDEEVSS
jgi:tetratricopeptide (TPR) repeat protein